MAYTTGSVSRTYVPPVSRIFRHRFGRWSVTVRVRILRPGDLRTIESADESLAERNGDHVLSAPASRTLVAHIFVLIEKKQSVAFSMMFRHRNRRFDDIVAAIARKLTIRIRKFDRRRTCTTDYFSNVVSVSYL